MEEKLVATEPVIHPNSNVALLVEWFLSKGNMSHKKIQKLCYYAEAWSLVLLDTDIVPDIEFEAWVHGPVNKDIYRRCHKFGWRDIMVDPDCKEKSEKEVDECFSELQKDVLELVWNSYGEYDADELEILSHQEEPWKKAREGYSKFQSSNVKIDKNIMKEYYRSRYEIQSEC